MFTPSAPKLQTNHPTWQKNLRDDRVKNPEVTPGGLSGSSGISGSFTRKGVRVRDPKALPGKRWRKESQVKGQVPLEARNWRKQTSPQLWEGTSPTHAVAAGLGTCCAL